MPLRRIGEGLVVIGFVAIACMIVVAIMSRNENTALTITAVLGFGASTIGGVLALLAKLDDIETQQEVVVNKQDVAANKQDVAANKQDVAANKQDTNHEKLDIIHHDTNANLADQKRLLAEALAKIAELEKKLTLS